MIPILYSPLEKDFLSNGVGRLSECASCIVTEERNGIYECEFVYPCSGRFYEQLIRQNGIIGVIHDDDHDIQPFEIYRHSDPINGMVTFNAHHISYRLSNVIVKPFTAYSAADAMDALLINSITDNEFTFWTNKSVAGTFKLDRTAAVRELLCGQEGSILDVYGKGEYEFDKYTVRLYVNRGINRGVTIRYGKNMVDFERTYDESSTFNAVAPYWKNSDGSEVVTLPEGMVVNTAGVIREFPWEYTENGAYMTDENGTVIDFRPFKMKAIPLDMSANWEEAPTPAELRAAATAYLTNNEPWIPNDNLKINFVELWQTPEYENVAALQRVKLCDEVAVYYPELLVTNASVKVIKVVYNVLTEQYDEMELGEARTGIIDFINEPIETLVTNQIANEHNFTQEAIDAATQLITGGLGGHVVMNLNASGEPQEILIMDTDDINTAVHVIRMNQNGIGFSQTGYEGPFESAWTIDGAFNANFITAGTMMANRIYGGTLALGGLNNQSGVMVVRDADGTEIGHWNNGGIFMNLSENGDDFALFDKNGMMLKVGDSRIQTFPAKLPEDPDDFNWEGTLMDIGMLQFMANTSGGITYGASLSCATHSLSYTSYNGSVADTRSINIDIRTGLNINYGSNLETLHSLTYRIYDGALVVYGGSFTCYGTKSRCVETKEYSDRLLYCYETPTPMFGDVGEGTIDETGYCYVFLDAVFAETINTNQYQVFLQKYGEGDCWVAERKGGYFAVRGTAGLKFGWELKAKQKGYDQLRLERNDNLTDPSNTDYGALAAEFLTELEEGRVAA